jgi:hypothetical protein
VLLAEVLAHPDAIGLELRRIAPTVVVSPLPLAELMAALRSAGFSPVAEDPAGAVLDLVDPGRRTAPARRGPRPGPALRARRRAAQRLVARMRSGDALASVRRGATNGPRRQARRPAHRRPSGASRSGSASSTGTAWRPSASCGPSRWAAVSWRASTPPTGAATACPLHRITSIALVQDGA